MKKVYFKVLNISIIVLLAFLTLSCYQFIDPFSLPDRDLGNTLDINFSGAYDYANKELICLIYNYPKDNTADYIAIAKKRLDSNGNALLQATHINSEIPYKFDRNQRVEVFYYIDNFVKEFVDQTVDNWSYNNTRGKFGNTDKLYKYPGPNQLVKGEDYSYYSRLDYGKYNRYDVNNSGNLEENTWIRITRGLFNVNTPSGFFGAITVQPIKDYSISPAGFYDEANGNYRPYIAVDPEKATFQMPRPLYHCTFDSIAEIASPTFQDPKLSVTTLPESYMSIVTGKYNNALRFRVTNSDAASFYIYPLGATAGTSPNQGTLSIWVKNSTNTSDFHGTFGLNFGSSYTFGIQNLRLSFDHSPNQTISSSISTGSRIIDYDTMLMHTFHHIYMVWDIEKRLPGNKSLIIYINNVTNSSLQSNLNIETLTSTFSISLNNGGGGPGPADFFVDNLYVWDHIVSTTPNWIYGDTAGDSIHYCYGSGNNYKPNSNIFVTYYAKAGRLNWPDEGEVYFEGDNFSIKTDMTHSMSYSKFTPYSED